MVAYISDTKVGGYAFDVGLYASQIKCNNINDVKDIRKKWNYYNEKIGTKETIKRLRKQITQMGEKPCA